eukprot:7762259-Ditylum_brightwellii.AAC.1
MKTVYLALMQSMFLVGNVGALSSPALPHQQTPVQPTPKNTCSNIRPNFRSIMRRAGKTFFRPGGTESTNKLLSWSTSLGPGHNVIEIAADMGKSAIAIAKQFGCHVTLLDLDIEQHFEHASGQTARDHDIDLSSVETMELDM